MYAQGVKPGQNSARSKEKLDAKDVKQDAAVEGLAAFRCDAVGRAAGAN